MLEVKTVLCPIDFSDLSRRELAIGVEVCRAFGARIVLHHNLPASGEPGAQGSSSADAGAIEVEKQLDSMLESLPGSMVAGKQITRGPLEERLQEAVKTLSVDLLVIGSHGWSTRDHSSLTEGIIERSTCPVLTLHEGVPTERFDLRPGAIDVLVTTDLTETGAHAMAYAFELARRIPMRLHVLHVAARGADGTIQDDLLKQLYGLVPADLVAVAPLEVEQLGEGTELVGVADPMTSSVECYVRRGDPIEEILTFGEHLDPTFVVMGEHAQSFFRRHFTRDSAVEVLHGARWPVWFVPANG